MKVYSNYHLYCLIVYLKILKIVQNIDLRFIIQIYRHRQNFPYNSNLLMWIHDTFYFTALSLIIFYIFYYGIYLKQFKQLSHYSTHSICRPLHEFLGLKKYLSFKRVAAFHTYIFSISLLLCFLPVFQMRHFLYFCSGFDQSL